MAEYIEREAAIAGLRDLFSMGECYSDEQSVVGMLNALPAADVRSVVKCEECQHWIYNGTDLCSCERDALLRRRDFFCADWERK